MRGQELEETADGAAFEEVEQYLDNLDMHVKSLAKSTLFLVDTSKDMSRNYHELGQTLFGLHQMYDPDKKEPSSNGEDGDDADNTDKYTAKNLPKLKTISNIFASLSAINKVKHDESHEKVSTPITDLEWSIKAKKNSILRS